MPTSAVPVNLADKLSQVSEEDTDELFLVISGRLTIQLREGDVVLEPGELTVVPRGVEHRPMAAGETAILLFESRCQRGGHPGQAIG